MFYYLHYFGDCAHHFPSDFISILQTIKISSGMIFVPQSACYVNSHVFGGVESKDSCMSLLTELL